jgi:2-(1,2-epoxy-1,2-dihydrophenyl)acetyl-CoA isomerase
MVGAGDEPVVDDLRSVQVEEWAGVASVTLDRPARLNAIDRSVAAELEAALARFHDDVAVRAVVVRGTGRAFCAGADIHDMLARPARHQLDDLERGVARAAERARLTWATANVLRLHELPKPTIAAVHGAVAGAGLCLALACDVRIAGKDTVFRASYGRLGLPGDWGVTALLPDVVGSGVARRMLLRGEVIAAEEARQVGLVDEVVPVAELTARTAERAAAAAAGPTLAYGEAKRLLRRVDLRPVLAAEIEATLRCQETADHAAALRAFAAREDPVFAGS